MQGPDWAILFGGVGPPPPASIGGPGGPTGSSYSNNLQCVTAKSCPAKVRLAERGIWGLFAVNVEKLKRDFAGEEMGIKIKIAAAGALLPCL